MMTSNGYIPPPVYYPEVTVHDSGSYGSRQSHPPPYAAGMPNTEYPVPVGVRNTFLHFPVPRDASLDDYFNERKCNSAPQSKLEGMNYDPTIADSEGYHHSAAGYRTIMPPHVASLPSSMVPSMAMAPHFQSGFQSGAQTAAGGVLHLADILENGEQQDGIGSDACPTVGSLNHAAGKCKPCAFFWKQAGCGNGYDCPFCHLCGPDEKKRRRKERRSRPEERSGPQSSRALGYDNEYAAPNGSSVPCLSLKEGLRRILQ